MPKPKANGPKRNNRQQGRRGRRQPQRAPDVGSRVLFADWLTDETFRIFGTGEQTRDFTFVGDIVDVTIAALTAGPPGMAYNIGGGNRVSLKHVVDLMAKLTGAVPRIEYEPFEDGDMMHTMADTSLAGRELHYAPSTGIEDGLAAEIEWMKKLLEKEK